MTLAERIREVRTRAGLSLTSAAEEIGVDRSTVHRWECGRRDPAASPRLVQKALHDWLERKEGESDDGND